MTVRLSMDDMKREPEVKRTTFPRPSAGRPTPDYTILREYDEEDGTYEGMTQDEFLGYTPGDQ